MFTSICSFLAGIARTASAIFTLRSCANRQRREAESDVSVKEAELKAKTDMIKEAVYSANDARLNEIVLGLMSHVIVFALVLLTGCSAPKAEIVYIPTDRKIESCTNSLGIACKAVPDAVMAEMLEMLQELKDLKTEMKVDKRVGK